MAYDPEEKARAYNQAIAQGLDPEEALAFSGLTNETIVNYAKDTSGSPNPGDLNYNPNWGQLMGYLSKMATEASPSNVPDYYGINTTIVTPTGSLSRTVQKAGGLKAVARQRAIDDARTAIADALAEKQQVISTLKSANPTRPVSATGSQIIQDPRIVRSNEVIIANEVALIEARDIDPASVTVLARTNTSGQNTTVYQPPTLAATTTSLTAQDPNANLVDVAATPINLTEEQIQAADNPVNPAVDPTAGQFVYDADGTLLPADSAPAELIQAESTTVNTDFTSVYNVETGNFDVIDDSTGEVVQSGLTEQAATLAAQNAALGVTGVGTNGTALTTSNQQNTNDPVNPNNDPTVSQTDPAEGAGTTQTLAEIEAAQAEQSRLDTLRAAQNIRELRQEATQDAPGDWRVKLRLAPLSKYLYNDPDNNILAPLRATDGVIFPYTPQISTVYHANYNSYDLTHSNHRGYFYQNSYVGEVQIQATFTAQDTREAEYLLAVIHFFRSATKMFYGGGNGKPDEQIGSPPPLVFLSGLGDYQFSEHPCVISQFNYNLPNDVDYLRVASPSIVDTNLQNRRPQQATTPTSLASLLNMAGLSRLAGVGATPGAAKPITTFNPGNLGLTSGFGSPTYVPSKIDLNLVLLPVQSRKGVSQQFSLRDFAAGNLLKGGFW